MKTNNYNDIQREVEKKAAKKEKKKKGKMKVSGKSVKDLQRIMTKKKE
jgi:hypothetical protein